MAVSNAVHDISVDGIYSDASGAVATDSSDWEYEYDETETEAYYFTLDVTTHQPQAGVEEAKPKRKYRKSKKAAEAEHARNEEMDEAVSANQIETQDDVLQASTLKPAAPSKEPGRLQLLDLHSDNPLIMHDGDFYTCHWSTDLGTQFYVARPGIVEQPLRPGHVLDVVGMSRARLTGKAAILRERRADVTLERSGSSAGNAISIEDEDKPDASSAANSPDNSPRDENVLTGDVAQFSAARGRTNDPKVKAQASFLERLTAMKRRKGEMDTPSLHGAKPAQAPAPSVAARGVSFISNGQSYGITPSTDIPSYRREPYIRGPYKKRKSAGIGSITDGTEANQDNGDVVGGSGLATSRALADKPRQDPETQVSETQAAVSRSVISDGG